jgi:hypothetical protein
MFEPNPWGWRAVMFDLRMPDGQLVEYYLTVTEIMDANDNVHHTLYEKWRNAASADVSGEFGRDLDTSNAAFDEALDQYLNRTGQTEDTIREVLAQTDAITG